MENSNCKFHRECTIYTLKQTMFGVKCSPKSAAFYLLDQLLNGFDVDRNVENAREVVALGGLSLLITRLETVTDASDRKKLASFLACTEIPTGA